MPPKTRGKAMMPASLAVEGYKARSMMQYINNGSNNNINSNIPTNTPTQPPPTEMDRMISEEANKLESLYKTSPFYIDTMSTNPTVTVERYSDKYKNKKAHEIKISSLNLNTELFPDELYSVIIPNYSLVKKKIENDKVSIGEVLAKIKCSDTDDEELEQEDQEEEEEIVEEEVEEEDNDYCVSYFDAGDDYGDYEGGGGDDGPEF